MAKDNESKLKGGICHGEADAARCLDDSAYLQLYEALGQGMEVVEKPYDDCPKIVC